MLTPSGINSAFYQQSPSILWEFKGIIWSITRGHGIAHLVTYQRQFVVSFVRFMSSKGALDFMVVWSIVGTVSWYIFQSWSLLASFELW